MTYFVYYDETANGAILSISPKEMIEMEGQPFIKIAEEEALEFIQGTEKISKWKVNFLNEPELVKKDNYVFYQYDYGGFFNIEEQSAFLLRYSCKSYFYYFLICWHKLITQMP